MPMIDIKNVSKWYGSFQVLKNCSTSVEKGEVVVVCGPSGSGKSTLIKTVNALEPFQQGEIFVDGVNVGDPKTDLPKLRAHASHAMNGMAKKARKNILRALSLFLVYSTEKFNKVQEKETLIDKYEDKLGTYLMQMSTHEMNGSQAKQIGRAHV